MRKKPNKGPGLQERAAFDDAKQSLIDYLKDKNSRGSLSEQEQAFFSRETQDKEHWYDLAAKFIVKYSGNIDPNAECFKPENIIRALPAIAEAEAGGMTITPEIMLNGVTMALKRHKIDEVAECLMMLKVNDNQKMAIFGFVETFINDTKFTYNPEQQRILDPMNIAYGIKMAIENKEPIASKEDIEIWTREAIYANEQKNSLNKGT